MALLSFFLAIAFALFVAMAFTFAAASRSFARLIGSFLSPERSLAIEAKIKCAIVDYVDRFIEMGLSGCCRIELTSPVIESECQIGRASCRERVLFLV